MGISFLIHCLIKKKKDQVGEIEKWSSVYLTVIFGNLNESVLATYVIWCSFKQVTKKTPAKIKTKQNKQSRTKIKKQNKTKHITIIGDE